MYDFAYLCNTKKDIDAVWAMHQPYTPFFTADGIWENHKKSSEKDELCVVYVKEDMLVGWDHLSYCKKVHPQLTLLPASDSYPQSWGAKLEEVLS